MLYSFDIGSGCLVLTRSGSGSLVVFPSLHLVYSAPVAVSDALRRKRFDID